MGTVATRAAIIESIIKKRLCPPQRKISFQRMMEIVYRACSDHD